MYYLVRVIRLLIMADVLVSAVFPHFVNWCLPEVKSHYDVFIMKILICVMIHHSRALPGCQQESGSIGDCVLHPTSQQAPVDCDQAVLVFVRCARISEVSKFTYGD